MILILACEIRGRGGERLKIKRIMCALLTLAVMVSCLPASVCAAEVNSHKTFSVTRATGQFSMEIPGETTVKAATSFPLVAGETVAINAVYTPQSASVDFGLLAPDGLFHPVNTTDGSFDETIRVNEKGNYTLVIRNNSSYTISVSGYVTY